MRMLDDTSVYEDEEQWTCSTPVKSVRVYDLFNTDETVIIFDDVVDVLLGDIYLSSGEVWRLDCQTEGYEYLS